MKEIVIKIDDDIYEWVRDNILFTSNTEGEDFLRTKHELTGAIAYGKVLPKGHGRLIDADTLVDGFEDNYEFCEALNATPTLVEADKGAEE